MIQNFDTMVMLTPPDKRVALSHLLCGTAQRYYASSKQESQRIRHSWFYGLQLLDCSNTPFYQTRYTIS